MKQYISEEEAIYQDTYHGQFSRKLAKWAIENMEVKDAETGRFKRLPMQSVDDVMEIMKANSVVIPEESVYTAWYLYMMSRADYPKTLKTDAERASYVNETLNDPDGCPEDTLCCFVAKMCNAGIPIFWERFL